MIRHTLVQITFFFFLFTVLSGCDNRPSKVHVAFKNCLKIEMDEIRLDPRMSIGKKAARKKLAKLAQDNCKQIRRTCKAKPRGPECKDYLWQYL